MGNARAKVNLAEWILDRLRRGEPVPGYDNVIFNPLLVNDLAGIMLSRLDARLGAFFTPEPATRSANTNSPAGWPGIRVSRTGSSERRCRRRRRGRRVR